MVLDLPGKHRTIIVCLIGLPYYTTYSINARSVNALSINIHVQFEVRDWSLITGRGATKWENRRSETFHVPF